jgi:N-acetylmuramoyl-L-alanine amidase
MISPTIILDPGHGMSNRKAGQYDPGVVFAGVQEAAVALDYANEIRAELLRRGGIRVVRTRAHTNDPAPIGRRASIARQYNGRIMLSIHTNSAGPTATGVEVFYRGDSRRATAAEISAQVARIFGLRDRGARTENQSQHKNGLAVMGFQPTYLLELGFITNPVDRAAFLDPQKRAEVCRYLAGFLRSSVIG